MSEDQVVGTFIVVIKGARGVDPADLGAYVQDVLNATDTIPVNTRLGFMRGLARVHRVELKTNPRAGRRRR